MCSKGGARAPEEPKRLWSQVARAAPTNRLSQRQQHPVVHTRTVKLRVKEMEGADPDTPEEKLQRIQRVIPEAKAVIGVPIYTDIKNRQCKENKQ